MGALLTPPAFAFKLKGQLVSRPLARDLKGYWRMEESSWDGSSGEVRDISGQSGTVRENLILNSEDMTAAGWTPINAPIRTATTLEDNSATLFERLEVIKTGVVAGQKYTYSVSVPKKGSQAKYAGIIIVSLTGGAETIHGVAINPVNGTITDGVGGGFTAPDASSIIEDPENSLYWRVSISGTVATNNTVVKGAAYPAVNTDGSATWVASTIGTNTFERHQLEQSSSPTDYVQTTGSAVTEFGNNGRAINGASTIAAGKLGRAGTFDGVNQYISVGTGVGDYTDNFTLAAWVNTSIDAVQDVFAKNEAGAQQYVLQVGSTATGRKMKLFWTGGSASSSAGNIFDGEWHFVAVVIDGSASQMYIDGLPDGDTFTPAILSNPAVATTIGARNLGTVEPFDGSIDEASIWSRALSAYEISSLYNGGSGLMIL